MPKQYIGFVLILSSGFLLALTRVEKKIFRLRPSFWWAMLSSFLFAIAAVVFKFVVDVQNFFDTMAYENLGIGIGALIILMWPGYAQRFIKIAKSLPVRGWIAVFSAEGFYLAHRFSVSFAISVASVSLVSVLAGFQPVFLLLYGLILSHWFPNIIKEEVNRKVIGLKVVAIFLIFAGLILIYF